jgi:hypothetical protein
MEPTINNNPALKISELMTRWQCCRKTVYVESRSRVSRG